MSSLVFPFALGPPYYHIPSFTCSFHFVSSGFTFLCLSFTSLGSLLSSQTIFRPFSVSFFYILLPRPISHSWLCSSVLSPPGSVPFTLVQFLFWFSGSLEACQFW